MEDPIISRKRAGDSSGYQAAAAKRAQKEQEDVALGMTPDTAVVTRGGQVLGTVAVTNMGVVFEGSGGQRVAVHVPGLTPPSVVPDAAKISPETMQFFKGNDATAIIPGSPGTQTVPVNFWDMLVQVMILLNKNAADISKVSMTAQAAQAHLRYEDMLNAADKQIEAAKSNMAAGYAGAATSAASGAGTIIATSASAAAQHSNTQKAQQQSAQSQEGKMYASDKPSQQYINQQVQSDPGYQNAVNTRAQEIQTQNPNLTEQQVKTQAQDQITNEYAARNQNQYQQQYQTDKAAYNQRVNSQIEASRTQTAQQWQAWGRSFSDFTQAGGGVIQTSLKFQADKESAEATRAQASATTHETAAGMEATAQKSAQDSMTAFLQATEKLMNLLATFWNPSGFKA